MRGHIGRLVDSRDELVLVDHFKRKINGKRIRRHVVFCVLNGKRKSVAVFQNVSDGHKFSVHEDPAV